MQCPKCKREMVRKQARNAGSDAPLIFLCTSCQVMGIQYKDEVLFVDKNNQPVFAAPREK